MDTWMVPMHNRRYTLGVRGFKMNGTVGHICWLDLRGGFFCEVKGDCWLAQMVGESKDKDTYVLDVKRTPYALTGGGRRGSAAWRIWPSGWHG